MAPSGEPLRPAGAAQGHVACVDEVEVVLDGELRQGKQGGGVRYRHPRRPYAHLTVPSTALHQRSVRRAAWAQHFRAPVVRPPAEVAQGLTRPPAAHVRSTLGSVSQPDAMLSQRIAAMLRDRRASAEGSLSRAL